MSVLYAADRREAAVRAANDPERMRTLLDAWFAAAGRAERVAALAVQRILWLPGSDFTAVYGIELQRGSEREAQLLFGDLCYDADAAALVAKAARKAERGKFVAPKLGAPAYHLPELGMALWTFPNDPKLKTLPRTLQGPVVRAALARLGGPHAGANGDWEVGAFDQKLVRYIPRKRCVFRFDIEWKRSRDNGDGAPLSKLQHVYGKVYDDPDAAADAQRILEAMWRAAQADARWLRVPRPLSPDLEQHTVYQTAVGGEHLTRRAATVSPAQVAAIGRGLALLQTARLPVRPALPLELEFEKMQQQARLVAMLHPNAAEALSVIETRLAEGLPRLPRLPLVPCHGTFKLNHLLDDGTHTSLVDFDSFVLADPIYDVANFVADLHYLEAQGALPAGRAAKLARAFYDAWSATVPWGRRDGVLDWYVASLLVRKQALKPVKHLHADAPAKIDQVLAEAALRLGGHR
jgi:hypothetical protein